MSSWRPETAWPIALSDGELMQIGFIAQCDELARQTSLACLKAVKGWDSNEWVASQKLKFFDITKQLQKDTKSYSELTEAVSELEAERIKSQDLRNRYVHSVWGGNSELGRPNSYDYRHLVHSIPQDIEKAVEAGAQLTILARKCLESVADLICDSKLAPGTEGVGMEMFWRGRFIKF